MLVDDHFLYLGRQRTTRYLVEFSYACMGRGRGMGPGPATHMQMGGTYDRSPNLKITTFTDIYKGKKHLFFSKTLTWSTRK